MCGCGNICRSPAAEFVMKDLVKKAGLSDQFHIESAAAPATGQIHGTLEILRVRGGMSAGGTGVC